MCYNKDKEKIQEVYSMANNKTELSVSTDVLEKMAELAAKEVEGVAGLSRRSIDLKGIMKNIDS